MNARRSVRRIFTTVAAITLLAAANVSAFAQSTAPAWSAPVEGTYVVREFRFADGESMKNLRLHYVTLGTPHRNAAGHVDNAVLVLHGTGADTNQFLREQFAGVLFVPGGLLDASEYFIIITDGIGHGMSSKPSDGLHATFPHYGYRDMVRAQHDVLVGGLHVDHLRLVMGTSMGGMQTWLWGETYPTMMGALMPLASLPIQISGRNRIWRDMIVDDLRNDRGYAGGEYTSQPRGLKAAVDMLWVFGSAPLYDQSLLPTRDAADAYYENTVKKLVARYDANDMIYQFESSRDYDPAPDLGKIVAPLRAINSADDQINPPELGIIEQKIAGVRHGRFVLLPISPETRGHGTHTLAAQWQEHLCELLATRVDVRLPRRADGRTSLTDGVTLKLPDGWLADTNVEGAFDRILAAKGMRPYLPLDTEPLRVTPRGFPKQHPRLLLRSELPGCALQRADARRERRVRREQQLRPARRLELGEVLFRQPPQRATRAPQPGRHDRSELFSRRRAVHSGAGLSRTLRRVRRGCRLRRRASRLHVPLRMETPGRGDHDDPQSRVAEINLLVSVRATTVAAGAEAG
ncbi:MAG: alpha/beta fold hydrolase [Candidatus Eremiobacteraeota bacterium]|nr:alpha/beta fold hydrolase [Candidatus Eremiobacteraeota bacterium]